MPTVTHTFALIKSKAIEQGHLSPILDMIRKSDLTVAAYTVGASKVTDKDPEYKLYQALYAEHEGKPYYDGLIESVTTPVGAAALILRGEDAVERWRALLGATDPKKASPGTIRARFGTELPHNAAHGSDSPESAAREIALFFPDTALQHPA